ncbi:hypothetical protein TWF481_003396 [Arthrobotrys musiformis]|uniref:Extracellular membrane protein CFEM domain-containing protein n=1 Tax=Arthrobotrys musiformis TaxID=47236 RepID=A0AAV9VR76_9PEZI
MRILTLFAVTLTALQGVAAVCDCPNIAAQTFGCDEDDTECLCDAENYLEVLNSCARFRRGQDCSDREIQRATNAFNRVCSSESSTTSTARSSTIQSTSTSISSSSEPTTTSAPASSTSAPSSSSLSSSSASSTTSEATMTPTNTAAPAGSNNSKSGLTTAQIGGIAGGSAGLILIVAFLLIFFKFRTYKKIDKKQDAERNVEAEKFMDGGRQMRAASLAHGSDRLYSTSRPLSHALGEYDSSRYQAEDDDDESPNSNTSGNYFNRFSGNHVDDSTSAFSGNSPQGYNPPSSFRNSQRSSSVPMYGPGGPPLPTASLSYEEYRSQGGERSSLMSGQSQTGSTTPHRSVSAPTAQMQLPRISRRPVGSSLNDRSTSDSYSP